MILVPWITDDSRFYVYEDRADISTPVIVYLTPNGWVGCTTLKNYDSLTEAVEGERKIEAERETQ